MAVEEIITILEVRGSHDDLVEAIDEVGIFIVPKPNSETGLRVGHIDVKEPKPDHPTAYHRTYEHMPSSDCPLPVAYIGYGQLNLVNTNKEALRDYHVQLRKIAEDFLPTQTRPFHRTPPQP